MKLGNGEDSMNTPQILHITDYRLLINVEHGHQIRTEMCDVKSTVVAVQALIIEARRPARQWHITKSAQGKVGRDHSRTITIGPCCRRQRRSWGRIRLSWALLR